MNRFELLRRYLNKNLPGVEIGPCHAGIAPKRDGWLTTIIDHTDQPGLLAKYAGHSIDLSAIEPVDFFWDGRSYSELLGGRRYSWVVASHVIEHVPSIIKFINECAAILEPGGRLVLAVPDCRGTFDRDRTPSTLSQVLDRRDATRHSLGAVTEHFFKVVNYPGDGQRRHTPEQAKRIAQSVDYIDIHGWVFTDESFRVLMEDLYALGEVSLRLVEFVSTRGMEFYAVLG